MDISDFIGAAKTFHVLGIKVTKDGDLINEWYSEPAVSYTHLTLPTKLEV